jgi:hypothetical protein
MPEERFRRLDALHPSGGLERPYTATANEAHLSAEEAKAGQDPWLPGEDEDARRARDPEAPPSQRPETPHSLMIDVTVGSE